MIIVLSPKTIRWAQYSYDEHSHDQYEQIMQDWVLVLAPSTLRAIEATRQKSRWEP